MVSKPRPLRHKASNHREAREDAIDKPKDAPRKLEALILVAFIDQDNLQPSP